MLKKFTAIAALLGAAQAQDYRPSKFELSPFVGMTSTDRFSDHRGTNLTNGLLFGGRVSENLWRRFGLEQTLAWNNRNLEFRDPTPLLTIPQNSFDANNFRLSLDGLWHFTDRGSRFRPFLAGGIGGTKFSLTDDARRLLATPGVLRANGVGDGSSGAFQFNYGGGVKIRATDLLGVRFDLRGLNSRYPSFDLGQRAAGGLPVVPSGGRYQAAELSAGLVFNLGGDAASAASTPKLSKDFSVVSVTTDTPPATVQAQGVQINTPVRFKAEVRNPKNKKLRYRWMVDGQTVGTDSDTLVYTPTRPGPYKVEVEVTEAGEKNPAIAPPAAPVTVFANAPPPPPAPPKPHTLTVGPITADPANALRGVQGAANSSLTGLNASNSIGSGTPVRLATTATDSLGHAVNYTWLVNGQQAFTGNPVTFMPTAPGWYRIEARVVDTGTPAATANPPAPVTVYARDTRVPTATGCAVSNATLAAGQTSPLSMNGTVAQGHTLRILWTASEGTITNPTSAQATFNSAAVNFPANPQVQTKTITVTGTVTDDEGRTASCTATLRVSTDPQPVHVGDVLFSANSARVDNVGKRLLIERVFPDLTGPYAGYTLALVGHRDQRERRATTLDRNRVRNVTAVLSAGRNSCPALELTRVKADWVGVGEARMVELWLVPANKPMPASMKEVHTLEPRDIRSLGCPR
jgi:hypothetical protein